MGKEINYACAPTSVSCLSFIILQGHRVPNTEHQGYVLHLLVPYIIPSVSSLVLPPPLSSRMSRRLTDPMPHLCKSGCFSGRRSPARDFPFFGGAGPSVVNNDLYKPQAPSVNIPVLVPSVLYLLIALALFPFPPPFSKFRWV